MVSYIIYNDKLMKKKGYEFLLFLSIIDATRLLSFYINFYHKTKN